MMTEEEQIAAMLQMRPLLRVDLYLDLQAEACLIKGEQIKAKLEDVIGSDPSDPMDASGVTELHREFWFWVLGTYEFSRTLTDQKAGFAPDVRKAMADNLTFLTLLRVPFAKLRPAGTKGLRTIGSGAFLSISRIARFPADLFFKVMVGTTEHEYGMRATIDHFEAFVATVKDAIRAMPS